MAIHDQLDDAANKLAHSLHPFWWKEIERRGVRVSDPVEVEWQLETTAEAAGGADDREAAAPPGSGQITRLFEDMYIGCPSQRLVILGDPGAGKTMGMMLLFERILRERIAEGADSRDAVPVWLTLGGWDPEKDANPRHWIESALARDHPFLRAAKYDRSIIGELLRQRRLVLFLDGLDEMPPRIRGQALELLDLNLYDLRIVLTSRRREYLDAMSVGCLTSAVVIALRPVTAETVGRYLARDQVPQGSSGPQRVGNYLATQPTGVVAQALSNPFMLSLARSIYASHEPAELISGHFTDARQVRRQLFAGLLEISYPDHRQRARAVGKLTWLATKMGPQRDLAWWQIPTWLSAEQHWAGAALACMVGAFLALAPLLPPDHFVRNAIISVVAGPVVVLAAIFLSKIMSLAHSDLLGDTEDRFRNGPIFGSDSGPRTLDVRKPTRPDLRKGLGSGVVCGLVCAEIGNLVGKVADRPGLSVLLAPVLAVAGGVAFALMDSWLTPVADRYTATPESTFRLDRRTALVCGIAGGLVFGTFIGLAVGAHFGRTAGIAVGVYGAAVLATLFGNGNALAILFFEVFCLCTGGRPKHIIHFLQDAHERGILRRAGALYQFMHADLQDYLAAIEPATPDNLMAVREPESKKKYQVALSFASEDNLFVAEVTRVLKSLGISYYYYPEPDAASLGRDLFIEMFDTYGENTEYVVIFTSKTYFNKKIPFAELLIAYRHADSNRRKDFILPIRLDDEPMQVIPSGIEYRDGRELGPERVAQVIAGKVWTRQSEAPPVP
jgi:hypothetical protein